jgi:hypothetical protein
MGRTVNDNKLPYLDFARTTFIPPEMFNRMNRDVRLALTPRVRGYLLQSAIANEQKSPAPLYLSEESRNFARMLNRHFGLTFPEINIPPISWRIVSSLGGTRKSILRDIADKSDDISTSPSRITLTKCKFGCTR